MSNYICDKCNKTFKNNSGLLSHQRRKTPCVITALEDCLDRLTIKDDKINVLDLFCGCGGMSKGLEDAGFNIVADLHII